MRRIERGRPAVCRRCFTRYRDRGLSWLEDSKALVQSLHGRHFGSLRAYNLAKLENKA